MIDIDIHFIELSCFCYVILLDCKKHLAKSLFQFGGFGGNDYNVQLLELGLTLEQTMKNTPMIVNASVNGIEVYILYHCKNHVHIQNKTVMKESSPSCRD